MPQLKLYNHPLFGNLGFDGDSSLPNPQQWQRWQARVEAIPGWVGFNS